MFIFYKMYVYGNVDTLFAVRKIFIIFPMKRILQAVYGWIKHVGIKGYYNVNMSHVGI